MRRHASLLFAAAVVALAAVPSLLPDSAEERRKALDILREVISAAGDLTPEIRMRLDRVTSLFETDGSGSNVARMPAAARKSNRPQTL